MFHETKDLRGFAIHAADGYIGDVHDFLFDDQTWMIRYLVVDTSMFGRRVLISPSAVLDEPDLFSREIRVLLTREQVKKSPDLDTDAPVSRIKEREISSYYGWPFYWDTSMSAGYIAAYSGPNIAVNEAGQDASGTHLRSVLEIRGYGIHAIDGHIGHADEFIFNKKWGIEYLVVDTKHWLPGKKVLVAVSWIRNLSWGEQEITVDLPKQQIKDSPPYDWTIPLERKYQESLHSHYGRTLY
jgi:hypothetical protein